MAWTDTGLKMCIRPAVLTLKPLRMENKNKNKKKKERRPGKESDSVATAS